MNNPPSPFYHQPSLPGLEQRFGSEVAASAYQTQLDIEKTQHQAALENQRQAAYGELEELYNEMGVVLAQIRAGDVKQAELALEDLQNSVYRRLR